MLDLAILRSCISSSKPDIANLQFAAVQPMATRFLIPRVLQSYCKGKAELLLHGATVRELLNDLQRDSPSLYQCICDERGMIRKHVNLFINNEFLAEREGLDTSLQSEDVISVFQAVSGG